MCRLHANLLSDLDLHHRNPLISVLRMCRVSVQAPASEAVISWRPLAISHCLCICHLQLSFPAKRNYWGREPSLAGAADKGACRDYYLTPVGAN